MVVVSGRPRLPEPIAGSPAVVTPAGRGSPELLEGRGTEAGPGGGRGWRGGPEHLVTEALHGSNILLTLQRSHRLSLTTKESQRN